MRNALSATARRVGGAALAGVVFAAMLSCGPGAALARSQARCGAVAVCKDDPPFDSGDQSSAEQVIISGYITKQWGCTPATPPNPQSVTWDPPGFVPFVGGSGMIHDANPSLGGQFTASYVAGRWDVQYLYC